MELRYKHKPSDSPLDKRTVEELDLQEKLTLKYIEERFTREEAAIRPPLATGKQNLVIAFPGVKRKIVSCARIPRVRSQQRF